MKPVVPDPVEHDDDPVAKADQVVKVEEEPDQPGGIAAKVQAESAGDGGVTADGRRQSPCRR